MFIVQNGIKTGASSNVSNIQLKGNTGFKFKVASNATSPKLELIGVKAGGSDRKIGFTVIGGTAIDPISAPTSKTNLDAIDLTAGATYWVYSTGSTINIDSIKITGILEALPAAEVTKTANAANPAVIACDDGNYYAIAVVSKDDLTKSSILFKKGETAVSANITKVYESIKVNGKETLTASDFTSASGDYYVVAAKIKDVDEEASTAISNIAALTVEVVE